MTVGRLEKTFTALPTIYSKNCVCFDGIYTNDQPMHRQTESFVYADDLGIAVKEKTHTQVKSTMEEALNVMSTYYKQNSLKLNPTKTQVCAFHLNNHLAHGKLNVSWEGQRLEHTDRPKYLGVILDWSLTYKFHCPSTRQKVSERKRLLRKLVGSKWVQTPRC